MLDPAAERAGVAWAEGLARVGLTADDVRRLAAPDAEGVYPHAPELRLLVEKDFPCAHPHAPEAREPATERFAPTAAFLDRKTGERRATSIGCMASTAGRTRVARARVIAVRDGRARERADGLAAEEPLEIRAAGPGQEPVRVAVTMRTPGHDFELAAGFLVTEGLLAAGRRRRGRLLRGPRRPALQRRHGDQPGAVRPRRRRAQLLRQLELRHLRQGGARGRDRALRAARRRRRPPTRRRCSRCPDAMRAAQRVFDRTGGLHAAGLFGTDGELLLLREDVGRHNAVNKVAGALALEGADGAGRILLVSGRLSFEIVQKAAVARVPILCAVSAPSSLAVDAAAALGVTAVGFLRPGGFNIYSRPERIVTAEAP